MTEVFRDGNRRVFDYLADGEWKTAAEIEERCEVTAHSRLSDLRGAGHLIEKRRNPGATGRRMFSYRLVATAEQIAEARAGAPLGEPVTQTPAGSPSGERSETLGQRGDGPAGGADGAPAAGPDDPHELEDAGWRDLYDGAGQLELGGVA